jgi:Calcineurin-like phosphoesterase
MATLRICSEVVPKSNGTEAATILQLSDLHIKAKTPLRGEPGHGSFMLDLEIALRAEKDPIDLVVVTGDLVDASEFWAKSWSVAYDKALKVILEVCQIVNVNPAEGLLIIPGNHDLRWWGNKPELKLQRFFAERFQKYFYHSYYPKLGLLVACFDSNEQVGPLFFDFAKGMAATAQCDHVLHELNHVPAEHQDGAKAAFRLALIHHHLMAIPADDFAADLKIIGAPSLMMLRNAGSFLQRLLKDGYRLVLHGHLHTHGYWLPQTFFDGDESPRWLELISCGWAGVSSGDNVRTFNVVKVHKTGVVESRRVEFQAGRVQPRPIRQSMAGYNLVRTRSWDLRERAKNAVVCDSYSQRWDVILPEGDVVVTEVIRGLCGEVGEVGEMPIYKEAAGLTLVNFSAEYLGTDRRRIPFDRTVVRGQNVEETRIRFGLKFDPKLPAARNGKVDILLRSTIFGGVASSLEDQKYSGVADRRLGKEEVYHVVWRACGRLLVNVRFFSETAELLPRTMDLRVYDARWKRDNYELNSDHITWDFWSSDRESENVFELPSVPQASLSVYRPQMEYGYAVEWDLPRLEPIEDRDSLLNQRTNLLRLETPEALGAVRAFVTALKKYVVEALQADYPQAKWNDSSLGVYLYAFDSESAEMVRKCMDSFHDDPFPERIGYGRDFIGTAFRSWYPLSFNRVTAGDDALPLFERMPESVKYLFSCPLWRAESRYAADGEVAGHEPLDYAPVGVVAVASKVQGSGLGYIVDHDEATTKLNHRITELWYDCQVQSQWAKRVAP